MQTLLRERSDRVPNDSPRAREIGFSRPERHSPTLVVTAMSSSVFDRAQDATVVQRLKQVCRSLTEQVGDRWPAHSS